MICVNILKLILFFFFSRPFHLFRFLSFMEQEKINYSIFDHERILIIQKEKKMHKRQKRKKNTNSNNVNTKPEEQLTNKSLRNAYKPTRQRIHSMRLRVCVFVRNQKKISPMIVSNYNILNASACNLFEVHCWKPLYHHPVSTGEK